MDVFGRHRAIVQVTISSENVLSRGREVWGKTVGPRKPYKHTRTLGAEITRGAASYLDLTQKGALRNWQPH